MEDYIGCVFKCSVRMNTWTVGPFFNEDRGFQVSKESKVISFFKRVDRGDIEFCWIINNISKVFKFLLYLPTIIFTVKNMITSYQHGVMKHRFTTTNLNCYYLVCLNYNCSYFDINCKNWNNDVENFCDNHNQ